jgi:hypothetical protein
MEAARAGRLFHCQDYPREPEQSMSNIEEVERAEAKMTAAREALLSYIEGKKPVDRADHRRLVARLKKAEQDFMRAIAELDR